MKTKKYINLISILILAINCNNKLRCNAQKSLRKNKYNYPKHIQQLRKYKSTFKKNETNNTYILALTLLTISCHYKIFHFDHQKYAEDIHNFFKELDYKDSINSKRNLKAKDKFSKMVMTTVSNSNIDLLNYKYSINQLKYLLNKVSFHFNHQKYAEDIHKFFKELDYKDSINSKINLKAKDKFSKMEITTILNSNIDLLNYKYSINQLKYLLNKVSLIDRKIFKSNLENIKKIFKSNLRKNKEIENIENLLCNNEDNLLNFFLENKYPICNTYNLRKKIIYDEKSLFNFTFNQIIYNEALTARSENRRSSDNIAILTYHYPNKKIGKSLLINVYKYFNKNLDQTHFNFLHIYLHILEKKILDRLLLKKQKNKDRFDILLQNENLKILLYKECIEIIFNHIENEFIYDIFPIFLFYQLKNVNKKYYETTKNKLFSNAFKQYPDKKEIIFEKFVNSFEDFVNKFEFKDAKHKQNKLKSFRFIVRFILDISKDSIEVEGSKQKERKLLCFNPLKCSMMKGVLLNEDTSKFLLCKNCYKVPFKAYKCSNCKNVIYCSKHCQKRDWKNSHKKKCSKI